jgi:hypothetical protein
VKTVPRFFPFLAAPPIAPSFESARGGVPEMLDPSSTGTERLIPSPATGALDMGIATGTAGARVKVEETSGPGGDTEEDMDSEASELSVLAVVCNATGLRTGVRTGQKKSEVCHSRWTACGVACVAESSTHLPRR